MSTIVGQVSRIDGVVKAINPQTGESRTLIEGSTVSSGEIIQTSGKGGVVIEMNNGTLLTLGRDTEMLLDDDVTSTANFLDSGTEASVDIAALQQAILEGNFEALEATAAGEAILVGSASDGGVFVERIALEGQVTAGFGTQGDDGGLSVQSFDTPANDTPDSQINPEEVNKARENNIVLAVDETEGQQADPVDNLTASSSSADFSILFAEVTEEVDDFGDFGFDGPGSVSYALSLVNVSNNDTELSVPVGSGLFAIDSTDTTENDGDCIRYCVTA